MGLTFEEWWSGYSNYEHFNEPLETLRHSDHDDPNFDELIKGVAKMAWDKREEMALRYAKWVHDTDNGRRLNVEMLKPARGKT